MNYAAQPDNEAAHEKVLGCRDCGLIQYAPALDPGMGAYCGRCSSTLARRHHAPVMIVLAWAVTGFLLFYPALTYPIFVVSAAGIVRDTPVEGTAVALFQGIFSPVAIAVALFTTVIPLVWFGGLCLVLGCLHGGLKPRWLGPVFRIVTQLDIWAMPDVFLMGGFVAYTRLQDVAFVTIGAGGFAYAGIAFCSVMIRAKFDAHHLWREIMTDPGVPPHLALCCAHCGMVMEHEREGQDCPRCGGRVERRRPDGIGRAAALVAAAYLLYIPANLLPVLDVVRLGHEHKSTIFAGGLELIHAGMWPLALIVFTASIAVPVFKLFGLSWFLLSIRSGTSSYLIARTRLYRVIGAIGRWSNIDVFMIGLLVALIQFGNLTNVTPEPGAIAFAAVVIMTMFASHVFDARLMWDAAGARTTE